MGLSHAEAQSFHNSKLADSITSRQLLGSRPDGSTRSRTTQQQQQADTSTREMETDDSAAMMQMALMQKEQQQQAVQPEVRRIDTQIQELEEKIAALHTELGEFYKMLLSQWIPATATAAATVPEIVTSETVIVPMFFTAGAFLVRVTWFVMQSPKTKLWLRVKAMRRIILFQIIAWIPIIGVILQPDLISAAIDTPMQTQQKIRSIKSEIKQKKRDKAQLQTKRKQLLLTLS